MAAGRAVLQGQSKQHKDVAGQWQPQRAGGVGRSYIPSKMSPTRGIIWSVRRNVPKNSLSLEKIRNFTVPNNLCSGRELARDVLSGGS